MLVIRTQRGVVAAQDGRVVVLALEWDDVFRSDHPIARVREAFERGVLLSDSLQDVVERQALAPIVGQEVWAAGVTYFRSRDARMEESQDAAGGDLYARVYDAERPELFFKSSPHRVVGHGGQVAQLKRKPEDLVSYLFRHNSFPNGVFLMTGTGVVPPSDFTLASGDEVQIEISNLGRLSNTVA